MAFNDAGGYWDMDVHFDQNEPFVVAETAIKGSARVATLGDKFVVVYSESDQVVTSKILSSSLDGVIEPSLVISTNLEPSSSSLASSNATATTGGSLYFGAVQGSTVFVYQLEDDAGEITGWQQMDTTALAESIQDGPIALAVSSNNVVMLMYQSIVDENALACAIATGGVFEHTSNPVVVGSSIALASSGLNTFMVLAKDDNEGSILSAFTTDNGETWSLTQIVEPADGVAVNSPVGLVKTAFKWVPIWINKVGSVQSKPTSIETPTTTDWAAVPKANFFTGTGSLVFSNPEITSTGGDGWTLVAVDNRTNDVSFRACFDVPEETSAPSGEPDRTTPSPSTSNVVAIVATPFLTILSFVIVQICLIL